MVSYKNSRPGGYEGRKENTMKDLTAYIYSLMNGEAMTKEEWLTWIAKEEKDYNEKLTDEEKDYIISELDKSGFVK